MAAAAITFALGMFVRTSKAKLEAQKASAEGDLIARLLKERDDALRDAREAWATRTADAQAIARLMERETALRADIARLRDEFDGFKRLIVKRFPEASDFFPSSHGTD